MQELEMENMYQKAYIRVKCFKGLFTHDISNLFHTISNSLELCQMLLKDRIETEEILEYFKLIEEQINRGKKLVKNMRNLSELEEFEMPLKPINLFEILRNMVQFVGANFSKRIVNIEIDPETEEIYVLANELLLDVFENIMMNAIIYNRNEIIQIEVSISEITEIGRKFVKLEFKDNGIGIDDIRKYEILQEKHEKSKNSKGMGLGLSLAAKLVNLYEGHMWIEDRIKGDYTHGSNFVILIPKTIKPEQSFYAFRED
ncbi:MAG: sensor histidine kinase [Candidatus Hermodarchaeota archaeon]